MRWRPWLWFCVSVLCFVAAGYFWRLGDKWAAEKAASRSTNQAPAGSNQPATHSQVVPRPAPLLSQPGNLNYFPAIVAKPAETNKPSPLAYRLNNNPGKSIGEMALNERAILLENALIDTTQGSTLPIPDSLKAHGDPGAYVVQSRGPTDNEFHSAIKNAGASIVAYIPNNAYLIRSTGPNGERSSCRTVAPRRATSAETEP